MKEEGTQRRDRTEQDGNGEEKERGEKREEILMAKMQERGERERRLEKMR